MTEQCRHDWRYDRVDGISYFECRHKECHKTASYIQAGEMLNEYETLKAATERLSAEVAMDCGVGGGIFQKENRDALIAYANILEGKDERTKPIR